jgi:Ca2+-binding EF-hand superfamily protein
MKHIFLVLLAISPIPAVAQIPPAQLQQLKMTLDQLEAGDTDKDGYTTIDEVKPVRIREFTVLSEGKDEIDPALLPAPPQMRAMMLENMDKDRNGKLSQAEFVNGLPPIWGRMDQDGDNRISRKEIEAARQLRANMGG